MSFAFPWAFALLLLPLLARWLLPPAAPRDGGVALPPAIAAAIRPGRGETVARGVAGPALVLAWGLAVLALAGPRQVETLNLLPASGRDIVLAIDLSASMEQEDFDLDGRSVSRLAAVQAVASDFVRGRAGDRVGLVVFGERAYVAADPSHDVLAVAHVVENSLVGVSGRSTAIADGLGLALKRLRQSQAESRVVILLSDGQETSGVIDPVAAAVRADELGIRIHTIALGPRDLETAPDARDAVDSETLRRVASAGGGRMFRVRGTADLRSVTDAIDALEPSASDAPPIRTWREWWSWPAAAALALVLGLLLVDRRAA